MEAMFEAGKARGKSSYVRDTSILLDRLEAASDTDGIV